MLFIGYEGFGLITNAAADMRNPSKMLPRALYTSVILVIVIYLAVALTVTGNLSDYEIEQARDYALAQAANLHVMCAVNNCRYFEYPMPLNGYDQGMTDAITLGSDGEVAAPQKPGLGLDIDWERMDAMTTARY